MKTKLILAGGFLGAGKTTLLYEAAKELIAEGHKTGLITNDQAADLVDTVYLSKTGAGIEEVSGSCFCCNFPGFAEAIQALRENGAKYIIAEPVGSCTDLSATILQPLKDKYADQLELSPFTVLIDPKRLKEILAGRNSGLAESGAYIIRKQLEEADVIAINKADTLTEAEAELLLGETRKTYPGAEVMQKLEKARAQFPVSRVKRFLTRVKRVTIRLRGVAREMKPAETYLCFRPVMIRVFAVNQNNIALLGGKLPSAVVKTKLTLYNIKKNKHDGTMSLKYCLQLHQAYLDGKKAGGK